MSKIICSNCANKLPSENNEFEDDLELHSSIISLSASVPEQITENQRRPPRTSTPIQGQENNPPANFSDTVNNFFYQSWKCGLHSEEPTNNQQQQCFQLPQPTTIVQTLPNVTQVVFVNTVVVQPFITPSFQQMGIMPDGRVVLMQTYVPCTGYLV